MQQNSFSVPSCACFGFFPENTRAQEAGFRTSPRLILGTYTERTASVASGDLDGDGDMDLVVANGRHWPGQNRIFFNNGRGIFTVERPLGTTRATTYATELADLDNDGDLDIAVGNDMAPNTLFFNDGKGNFTEKEGFGKDYAPTRNLSLADLDQDGDMDILITNRGQPNEICLNDGAGNFVENLEFGSREDSTIDVEVADMDGDGDPDLILANRDAQPNYVYLNDGALGFGQKIPFGTGKDNTRAVSVADVDQDGLQDILLANIGEPNVICFGSKETPFTRYRSFRCRIARTVFPLPLPTLTRTGP